MTAFWEEAFRQVSALDPWDFAPLTRAELIFHWEDIGYRFEFGGCGLGRPRRDCVLGGKWGR